LICTPNFLGVYYAYANNILLGANMHKIKVNERSFIDICCHADNMADACRQLGLHPTTFRNIAKRLGCYKPNQSNRPKYVPHALSAADVEEKYLSNAHSIDPSNLRRLLIRTGIKTAVCEICGLASWMNKPIPLELHHKDGNRYNNILANLMILCPTCHAQITNGSNVGRKRNRPKKEPSIPMLCAQCGSTYRVMPHEAHVRKYCSQACLHAAQCKFNPTSDELLALFKGTPNYTKVAKHFGVTDNAVKKRCKKLGIYVEVNKLISEEKVKRLKENIRRSA